MFLMNHTLSFPWIWFFLSKSIIKKGPTCDFSVHMKENSTKLGYNLQQLLYKENKYQMIILLWPCRLNN